MTIEHIAIWVRDIEIMRNFYVTYFKMSSSIKYENKSKEFLSYFLSFESGARIEIMQKSGISANLQDKGVTHGFTHVAISLGSCKKVDELTEQLRLDGYKVFAEPRTTGDGYYESVILDPEGNHIEITA